jgi:hypothetical protein
MAVAAEVDELTIDEIRVLRRRKHTKASEVYLDVQFEYPDIGETWEGSVPVYYRRTGVFEEEPDGMATVVEEAYDAMHPDKREEWEEAQRDHWSDFGGSVTDKFFYELMDCEWTCQGHELPDNPNWARRIQDIKEEGYTLATKRRQCSECGETKTHLIMTRFPRGGPSGYETMSPELRKRILKVLGHHDVYENRTRRQGLLPDHKFPEIRWDETVGETNPDDMSGDKIKQKFQLLNNQRNQQKREVCRNCFQTGERGTPYGIEFFYEGGPEWPEDVPRTGPDAERGCIGCGWYDLQKWRNELNAHIQDTVEFQNRTNDIDLPGDSSNPQARTKEEDKTLGDFESG